MNTVLICVLVGALGMSIGCLIGMFTDEKINKTYFLSMTETSEKYFKEFMDIEKEYFQSVSRQLATAVDELNKSYEIPTWYKVTDKLPENDGMYYGRIDGKEYANSMWKVNFIDGEWTLVGYPEHKMEITEWTYIY